MSHPHLAEILTALGNIRNRFHRETVLQAEVRRILRTMGVPFEAEFRLDAKNRIDFMLEPGLGIECKTTGKTADTARQVYRYAEHLPEIILLCTKPGHTLATGEIRNRKREKVRVHLVETWKNPT